MSPHPHRNPPPETGRVPYTLTLFIALNYKRNNTGLEIKPIYNCSKKKTFYCTICYTNNMFSETMDTSAEVDAQQIKLLRQVSPARKLELLSQMNDTVRALALAGLRSRHPNDSPDMIKRRLADLVLGEALAKKVYGRAPYAT